MKVIAGKPAQPPLQYPRRPDRILPAQRHFTNFIDAYLELTSIHEASPKFHKWVAIFMLAACLERKVYLERGVYRVYPNLYMLLVGPSGIVKKSTTAGFGMSMLREAMVPMMANQVTQAALVEAIRSSRVKYDVPGESEPRTQSAITVYASEFKVLMDEIYGGITGLLTDLFDCLPYDDKTPWSRHTKGEGQIELFGPCINLLGCSTTAWLKQTIPVADLEGGFASRILYVVDNTLPERFIAIPEYTERSHELRGKLLDDLCLVHRYVGEMSFSEEAKAFYQDWYVRHMTNVACTHASDKFAGYLGRKGTMVEKLSMIMRVNEGPGLVIELRHIEEAAKLIEELAAGMYKSFATVGKNQNFEHTKTVYEAIASHQPLSQKDLFRLVWADVDVTGIKNCVADLQAMNLITMKVSGSAMLYETIGQRIDLEHLPELLRARLTARRQAELFAQAEANARQDPERYPG